MCFLRDRYTGAAWLSSARAVRCWVKSRNERNPYSLLLTRYGEHSKETAGDKPEEGGDDVKSSRPLWPGLQTCYNGRHKELRYREVELISKNRPQFGLESETRLHEVGIASNRISAMMRWICSRALYTPPVTSPELTIPDVAEPTLRGGRSLRYGWWGGWSRNKVVVPEGAAGSPPFKGVSLIEDLMVNYRLCNVYNQADNPYPLW
jgi:hypothetical protein